MHVRESLIAEILNSILDLGPVLLDRSSVGKLRDIYPITLFTLNNSLKVLYNNQVDCFFYLFTYSLWCEALLNPLFSPATRHQLYSLCFQLFIGVYKKYQGIKLPDNVIKEFVTMMTVGKLERIIPSIIMTIKEIERQDIYLRLTALGSHITEQQIGNIRSWCNYDHRNEVILHSTACHYFIKTNAYHIFPHMVQRTRLNSGGCKLYEGNYTHQFTFQVNEMAKIILSTISGGFNDNQRFNIVIQDFINFIIAAPFDQISLPSPTANMTIMNRYVTNSRKNSYSPVIYTKKNWTASEDLVIKNCIINQREDMIYAIFQSSRSENAIRARILLKKKSLKKESGN